MFICRAQIAFRLPWRSSTLGADSEASLEAAEEVLGEGGVGVSRHVAHPCLHHEGGGDALELGRDVQRWAWLPSLQREEIIDVNVPPPLYIAEGEGWRLGLGGACRGGRGTGAVIVLRGCLQLPCVGGVR